MHPIHIPFDADRVGQKHLILLQPVAHLLGGHILYMEIEALAEAMCREVRLFECRLFLYQRTAVTTESALRLVATPRPIVDVHRSVQLLADNEQGFLHLLVDEIERAFAKPLVHVRANKLLGAEIIFQCCHIMQTSYG